MLKFDVQTDGLQKMRAALAGFSSRRLAAAQATALTRATATAKQTVLDELKRSIDRPTPYTLRGLFMKGATAQNLTSRLWYGNEFSGGGVPQARYLYPEVEGGTRKHKRFEKALIARGSMPSNTFAVPAKYAPRDQYGNVPSGVINQILSQLGTELTAGFSRTLRQRPGESRAAWLKRKQKALGRAGGQYVAIKERRGKLYPGIYRAEMRDFGRIGQGRSGKLVPIFFFTRQPHYQARYQFYKVATSTVARQFPIELERAVREHIQRMQQAGAQGSFGGF